MGKRSRRRARAAHLGPAPSAPGQPDPRILAKVRALLAKAESTPFDAEAEALTAKAQELMTRYAITQAMVESRGGAPGDPFRKEIRLDPPYVSAKALLLGTVASANRCRSVWRSTPPSATVFGYEADLAAVEVLYTSLLIQVAQAIARAGPIRDVTGTSRTRSFRRAFLIGFATRIGERLREASAASSETMAAEFGDSLLPVLASRSARVDEAVRAAFPHVETRRFDVGHHGGFFAGREAGDRASLGTRPPSFLTANPAS